MSDSPSTVIPAPADLDPPVAEQRPFSETHHGITREDPYHWLKDPGYPDVTDTDVLDYLKAENRYFEAVMEPRKKLTESLFEELKGRIKEDDSSVPVKDGDYLYWWRFEKGAQYRQWLRKQVSAGDSEEGAVFLDEPALADGLDYFSVRAVEVSPSGRLLAWASDTDGSERYTIRVKDLETGETLADEISNTGGSIVWSEAAPVFLYTELSEQHRPYRVWAHKLGQGSDKDVLLYEEKDPSFFVGIGKTQSRVFLTIGAGDHVTSEIRLIDASDPFGDQILVAEREAGHEYDVAHAGDRLFIRTNDKHKNFRLVMTTLANPARSEWAEIIPGDDRLYLRGVEAFQDFLVLEERLEGIDRIKLRAYTGEESIVEFPETVYSAGLGSNPEFYSPTLRIGYTSMITPGTVYDYDTSSGTLTTRKVQEIPSGYDKENYRTQRLVATARDGEKVPISIVYHKDYKKGDPLHLYGYGAYGMGMTPGFSTARLSLLDRGFAFAIAHIRGGDEMGYGWYEAGKLRQRTNTFNDFVDCARHLIDEGYGKEGHISISGGSAGGTLMGAALNDAPDLWRATVAHVPFVDVLNTMLDDTLPLTPIEWPEWGNPIASEEDYRYIQSYSPYDQTTAKAYPPILITAGLSDPRVTYWEPAKWAAKLRALKTDGNVLMLKTNMGAGHAGKSGRFEALREVAEEYTFLLMAFGLAGKEDTPA
ncbi:MAG: S9 family peptidase [Alphaproteobacteria bacterium]